MDSNFKILYAVVFTMLSIDISNIAAITIKNIAYCCIIHNTSKSGAINLPKNSVLKYRGYL